MKIKFLMKLVIVSVFLVLLSSDYSYSQKEVFKSEYGYSIKVPAYWENMTEDMLQDVSKLIGSKISQMAIEKAFIPAAYDSLDLPIVLVQVLGENDEKMYDLVVSSGESTFEKKPGSLKGSSEQDKLIEDDKGAFLVDDENKIVYIKMNSNLPGGGKSTGLSVMMLGGKYGIQLNFFSKKAGFSKDLEHFFEIIDGFSYNK